MSANALRIAVIEDELPIRRFLRASLQAEGFAVTESATAHDGLRIITQNRPHLVLLDLGLPDGDGVRIIQEVRGWSAVPIIVLSARGEEKSKIIALDAGADDYVTKPFGVGELLARIRAALRHTTNRSGEQAPTQIEFGDIRVDLAARRVFKSGAEVKLTKTEFDLLALLCQNAGKVLTHRYLLREVWGPDAVSEPHYVRVFMANLRKKLEQNAARPRFLLTEQGVGYRLQVE